MRLLRTLPTPRLGTVIAWQRGEVAYLLAASVSAATAEAAARDVT